MKANYLNLGCAALVVLILLTACATVVPPVVEMEVAETHFISYISPENGDGVQDTLSVPVSIEPGHKKVIQGYCITVSDRMGNPVRTIEEEARRPGFWKRLFTGLGFAKKEGVTVPEVVLWDGRADDNEFVADGEYTVVLTVWDDKKRGVTAPAFEVMVDNTPPRISLSLDYRIFSPNGDGNKDSLPIHQSGSDEDLWEAIFKDVAGQTVLAYRWQGHPPEKLIWDGRGQDGAQLSDGLFSYEIAARDRAGNTGDSRLAGIAINTRPTPVSLNVGHTAFSPNGDGVADTLIISPIFPAEGLDGWTLEILDSSQRRVRRVQGTAIGAFEWDGRTDTGLFVADGSYTVELDVLYENGNNPRATAGPVMVDTVYPSVSLSSDYLLFSPDGDGKRDTLTIRHVDSSEEKQWQAVIRDAAGEPVRRVSWTGRTKDFIWDGKDGGNRQVRDGVYSYRISAIDEAGNAFAAELAGIRVDSRSTPLNLELSTTAFSPNVDGVLDSITLTPKPGLQEGISAWSLQIRSVSGRPVRQERGTAVTPFVWNGLTDAGTLATDGQYSADFEVIYEKGNNPKASSGKFLLDTIYPSAEITADYVLFSPDGDGQRDTVTLRCRFATEEGRWTGQINDASGTIVKRMTWSGRPRDLIWDGADEQGRRLADGEYSYIVSATDPAGNAGKAILNGIRIDTRPTPIAVRFSEPAFSPNGDGIKDKVMILPEVGLAEGIERWELRILDKGYRLVQLHQGAPYLSSFEWDGRSDKGIIVPDGEYTVSFEVLYANGRNPKTAAGPVVVDTVFPRISLSSEYTLFSPDGDGRRDTLTVRQSNSSSEEQWIGTFRNRLGAEVKRFSWKGNALDFVWDGKDTTGGTVADGTYSYTVATVDRAGNKTAVELPGVRVDNRPTPIRVISSASGFSPNGDRVKDTMSFSTYVGLTEGIKSWSLTAIDSRTQARVTIRGGSAAAAVPATLVWDGTGPLGKVVPEGSYYAQFTIEYEKGNLAEERSAEFLLDISPPKVTLGLSPLPFSPDGDGLNDRVTISLQVNDVSPVAEWLIRILDPVGNLFIEFAGTSVPRKTIVWDGKSPGGELVQAAYDYTVAYQVTDVMNNTASGSKPLPVDVYVLREGDRLRIQISSIYFAPFSAEFQPGREEDNLKTLRRLAEILKKFDQYQIAVEGHAVRIYWFDEQRGQEEEREVLMPLSLQRAEVVKKAMADLGIEASRMSTAGFGGVRPFVPHSDIDNRWKNRRVEFILVKK